MAEQDWRAIFEATFEAPSSAVEARIWREVYGPEYPEGIDPYSFITASELRRFVRELSVGPGDELVDMACGRGGAGLWVAMATGAHLTGIDIAESPLLSARARAAELGITASFQRGEFEASGLPSGWADAVMSIDALLFTPNKDSALVELRRVLKPGGRLVFTSWDYNGQPPNRPPQVPDHRPLLEAAGFQVRGYDETNHWRAYNDAIDRSLLAAVDELAAESGDDPAEVRRSIEEMAASRPFMERRFLAVAIATA